MKTRRKRNRAASSAATAALLAAAGAIGMAAGAAAAHAQTAPGAGKLWPNLVDNVERPLRYAPDGGDFVVREGGADRASREFFNRPLYGGNTGFRVDAGDVPEFLLYLPGRGGNLRLGVRTAQGGAAWWLHEAAGIVSRYRPGTMRYEVRDPVRLGPNAVLRVVAVATPGATDALVVRVEAEGDLPADTELVWAFGGVNGKRGKRDGDIGTEAVPIGQYFQMDPEACRDNRFAVAGDGFTLTSKAAALRAVVSAGARLALADARAWKPGIGEGSGGDGGADALLRPLYAADGGAAAVPELPVVVGRAPLAAKKPLLLGVARVVDPASATPPQDFTRATLPEVFSSAEAHFAALRARVKVETPDPYLDAAVGALNVAADAVWDEPEGAVMHGAIAWRRKLLGWRGPYAMDALGWHDRARRHLSYWSTRQNTTPVPATLPPPDEDANLARSEAALHSNGDMSGTHYDMNLVYVDALMRHLLWTGDREFARQVWPTVERHLAWERRLFRREFDAPDGGGGKLPLYEGYAAIWASDDLQYHGGGATHASAYNYWHNRMAARLAPLAGADPAPYAREADAIARGMRALLWTPGDPLGGRAGDPHFAEFKDLLGLQLVHPSAGLWTFYHALDSGLPTTAEARSMARDVLARLPMLPVRGPGVPADAPYAMLATTDWMPYTWSINNVVLGENVHAALALWQADLPEEAYRLTKASLLASMYMGICPGNVGSMNYLDVYRRESQRDFADGSGVLSRAVVEGLFGVRPDLLAGRVVVRPGLPAAWDRARLTHPRVAVEFRRTGETADEWTVEPRFGGDGGGAPLELLLEVPARFADARVTVNGKPATAAERTGGALPRLRVRVPDARGRLVVRVDWSGGATPPEPLFPPGEPRRQDPPPPPPPGRSPRLSAAVLMPVRGPQEPVDLSAHFNDRVTEIFRPGKYRSPRSPFASLALPAQGIGAWAGHVNATAEIDDAGLRAASAAGGGRVTLPNGRVFATPGPGSAPNVAFTSRWDNYPAEVRVPLSGAARGVALLLAGSTNHMQSRLDNGEVVVEYADGGPPSRLALRNPDNWWPIDQDYFLDDYQFRLADAAGTRRESPPSLRVDLKTGRARIGFSHAEFKGRGGKVPGGAANCLTLTLDPKRPLRSLTLRARANEVVIGLMAATLDR